MTKLHLDFETYCALDIRKVGLDAYVRNDTLEVLMTAWAVDQGPVQWMEGWSNLGINRSYVEDPTVLWYAFNAPFERLVLKHGLGIDVPIERWRCTMVHAYSCGFSGTLADVGKQIGLPEDRQKLARGRQLIHKFCQPAPSSHKVRRYIKENSPQEWEEFKQYNIQDVVAEREIELWLEPYPMSQAEWELWFMDQRINDRGLPVDLELVDAALEVYNAEKAHLAKELRELTGLKNPNSTKQLLDWFHASGLSLSNLQADTLEKLISSDPPGPTLDPDMFKRYFEENPLVKKAIQLRLQIARMAGAKWDFMSRVTDEDSRRLRHQFQFYGAQRTGRWSGRGLQPHNLHRSPEDQDEKIRTMLV